MEGPPKPEVNLETRMQEEVPQNPSNPEAYREKHNEVRERLHAMIAEEIATIQKSERKWNAITSVAGFTVFIYPFIVMALSNMDNSTGKALSAAAPLVLTGVTSLGFLAGLSSSRLAHKDRIKAAYMRGEQQIEHKETVNYLYAKRHLAALQASRAETEKELRSLKDGGTLARLVRRFVPELFTRYIKSNTGPTTQQQVSNLEEIIMTNEREQRAMQEQQEKELRTWRTEVGEPIREDQVVQPEDYADYERSIRNHIEMQAAFQIETANEETTVNNTGAIIAGLQSDTVPPPFQKMLSGISGIGRKGGTGR